uniref:Ground-like domain-containing protein n=1 Tax=Syphacia muris TaxID=451379 RepID=A0A0N5AAN2_9BILA
MAIVLSSDSTTLNLNTLRRSCNSPSAKMHLLHITCITALLICAAETLEWQNGIQPQIQLDDILNTLKDTLLPSFYPKPKPFLQNFYYQSTTTTTTPQTLVTDINDISFLQELDSSETFQLDSKTMGMNVIAVTKSTALEDSKASAEISTGSNDDEYRSTDNWYDANKNHDNDSSFVSENEAIDSDAIKPFKSNNIWNDNNDESKNVLDAYSTSSNDDNSNNPEDSKDNVYLEQVNDEDDKPTVVAESGKRNLFGIPFSIKIKKSSSVPKYSTDRVRWRTVPSNIYFTATSPSVVPFTTVQPFPSATIQQDIMNMKEYAEKDITEESLQMICDNAKRLSKAFSIHDLPSFARKNCSIVRMYYPYATCEKIAAVLDYCFPPNPLQPSSFV